MLIAICFENLFIHISSNYDNPPQENISDNISWDDIGLLAFGTENLLTAPWFSQSPHEVQFPRILNFEPSTHVKLYKPQIINSPFTQR